MLEISWEQSKIPGFLFKNRVSMNRVPPGKFEHWRVTPVFRIG